MPAPEGHIDRNRATQIAGCHRNTITAAARAGRIPGATRRGGRGPWYFTEAGLRVWLGIADETAAAS